MEASWNNFTGTTGQKEFAANIVNSALRLLGKKVENFELKLERLSNEQKPVEVTRRRLVECIAKKEQIENFLASGKKVAAKKVIENSKKEDSTFEGWVISLEF